MTTTTQPTFPTTRQTTWPRWPLLVILSVLFLGPVIAPLFQATHVWLIADSGALARNLLASYVCPTPAKSYVLAGYPMAVCARCWGATIGLWAAWFVCRRSPGLGYARMLLHRYVSFSWPTRLALAAPPFLLWVAEITQWAAAPMVILLLNGALAGFSAGVFFCSIWPGLISRRRSH